MMERNETEQFLNMFIPVFMVFLPLLWGWVRAAWIVVEKLHAGTLQRPAMWRFILDFLPALTVGLLFTVIIYLTGLLIQSPQLTWSVKVGGLAFTFLLGGCILFANILVWLTLRSEI